MAFDIFILIIGSIFFILGFIYLFRRNILYGLFFAMLYLYSMPALIGYRFFPVLSVKLHMYFGEDDWYKYYAFIFLSILSFFICSVFFINRLKKVKRLCITSGTIIKQQSNLVYIFAFLLILFNLFNLIVNKEYFGYQRGSSNIIMSIGAILFRVSVGFIIVLLYLIRIQNINHKTAMYLTVLLIITLVELIVYCVMNGNRQEIAALLIGVFTMELLLRKLNFKTLVKCFGLIFVAGCLLNLISYIRSNGASRGDTFMEAILNNNYYPPAHILFTAITKKYVHPVTTFLSNICNSLILLKYPYLQAGVMDLVMPGVATRSQSYAFYIFSEGYLFMGELGFLYNGIVVSFWLYIWNRLCVTTDNEYNKILTCIMSCFTITLVRGQTSYFIKDLYINIIFNVGFYLMLSEKKFTKIEYR